MKTQEPQIWYRVRSLSIEKVLAVQTSDKFIRLAGQKRREAIDSDYSHYRPAFEQAKLVMIMNAEKERDEAKGRLAAAERELAIAQVYSEDRVQNHTKEFKL